MSSYTVEIEKGTKKEIAEYFRGQFEGEDGKIRCEVLKDSCEKGVKGFTGIYYAAVKQTVAGGKHSEQYMKKNEYTYAVICPYSVGKNEKGKTFMDFKTYADSDGPEVYTCPLSVLKLLTPDRYGGAAGQFTAEWEKKCRKNAEKMKKLQEKAKETPQGKKTER